MPNPNPTASSRPTAVVTGANRGIGLPVARQLSARGSHVVLVCRDAGRGAAARDQVAAEGASASLVVGDLAAKRGVHAVAAALLDACPRIDVLIHNAGVWPSRVSLTEDGLEQAFAVNHLAPFLLNHLLEDRLVASRARVVQVSAGLYVKGRPDPERTPTGRDFHPIRTYATTKACNVLMMPLFAQRWSGLGVTYNAVHPGVIRTGLGDRDDALGFVLRIVKRLWKKPDEGARPVVRLAVDPALAHTTGRYFHLEAEMPLVGPARDGALAARLWTQAAELTGVASPVPHDHVQQAAAR